MLPATTALAAIALTLGLLVPLPASAQPPAPPLVVPTVSPLPNAAGWNRTPVTVTWAVSSAVSLVSTVGCDPVTLTDETQGTVLTCTATNSAGGSTSVSVIVRIDRTAPATGATVTPEPGPLGWNTTAVTVKLTATDEGGSGVKQIHFTLSGAQTGDGVVMGSQALVPISAEGVTTITYFARDTADNQETPQTRTVQIDRTPPVIAGLPGPGCVLWPPNHRMVQVGHASADDAASGLVPGSLMVEGVSNEPEDGQGDGHTSPDIVITADHEIWVRAERAGGGSGRVYSLSATALDLAGNRAHVQAACVVPHDQRFVDVPFTHFAWAWIETLHTAGVTSGCRSHPLAYCPDAPVTREQMAVLLMRTRESPGYQPSTCTGAFGDVPCSSPFAPWIEAMVDAGVTAGCGGGNFCPRAPVTREQMAVFLLKAMGDPADPGACSGAPAADVPCSNPFASWIRELMDRGITAGCAPGRYCPGQPVTRAQMAVFLGKTFRLGF